MSDLLPLLLVAVCPLAMLLMMRGMAGGRPRGPDEGHAPDATVTARDARIAELEAQMRRLTDRPDLSEGTGGGVRPDRERSPRTS